MHEAVCPNCSAVVDEDADERCPECSAPLQVVCPSCGARVPEDEDDCPRCGTSLAHAGEGS